MPIGATERGRVGPANRRKPPCSRPQFVPAFDPATARPRELHPAKKASSATPRKTPRRRRVQTAAGFLPLKNDAKNYAKKDKDRQSPVTQAGVFVQDSAARACTKMAGPSDPS